MFGWLQLDFMVQALLACAAMGLLLAYLGIHVVGRGIVFVDLGLGQISSMGVAYAEYAGYDPVTCSMLFTLGGAAIFSRLRVNDPRLRLEAVIGIFYAVSTAITVLLIAKAPHGEADIQDVLFGNVLALSGRDFRIMLGVFVGVAVVNALFGRRFFSLTYSHAEGTPLTASEHGWNLLFYVLLAFAIVFAIRAGGVIPVFAFLIVPPVAAVALARRTGWVLALALLVAVAASFFGLHLSFAYDLPAGASIVAVLGVAGLLAALVGAFRRWRGRGAATAAFALLVGLAMTAPARAATEAVDSTELAAEVAALRAELAATQARLEALEARLAAAQPPAAPAATSDSPAARAAAPAAAPRGGGAGIKLLDIAFNGLFSAAGSSAREGGLRMLELGGHDPKNRGFTVQNLELTLSGVVDPYLRADANLIFQIDEEGESLVEVEEMYLTSLALPAGLQVKAGTFFSPFGRLNPQHPHQWEFVDQPVISGRLLGPDGLRGPGAQLGWLLPTPFYAEATVTVQNSHGETAASFRSSPGEELAGRTILERDVRSLEDLLLLGRFATSFDLTPELTILPGVSYVHGPNGTGLDTFTEIAGLDFYAKWKPLANDHGWPFVSFQAEWLERDYEAAEQTLEDGTVIPFEELSDRGGYAQGIWGFRRRWTAGLRYDWADGDDAGDPLRDARRRTSTNVTFYPSEFSKLRLQYSLDDAEHLSRDVSTVALQFEILYGAHGGHKF